MAAKLIHFNTSYNNNFLHYEGGGFYFSGSNNSDYENWHRIPEKTEFGDYNRQIHT